MLSLVAAASSYVQCTKLLPPAAGDGSRRIRPRRASSPAAVRVTRTTKNGGRRLIALGADIAHIIERLFRYMVSISVVFSPIIALYSPIGVRDKNHLTDAAWCTDSRLLISPAMQNCECLDLINCFWYGWGVLIPEHSISCGFCISPSVVLTVRGITTLSGQTPLDFSLFWLSAFASSLAQIDCRLRRA